MLTREECLRIAKLARLELNESEIELYRNRMGRVLDYMRELSAVPTSTDAFVRHVPKDAVAYREDRPLPFAAVKLLLDNAPAVENNSFALPAVMDNE